MFTSDRQQRSITRGSHVTAVSPSDHWCLLRAILALAAFALSVQPVLAATLLVDNTPGCNDGTGSPSYCHIQAAVNAASSGDTINVNVGVGPYSEQVTIGKSLTLVGVGTPTILAPGTLPPAGDVVTIQGAGVSVDIGGFKVSGPGPSGCGSIGAGIHVLSGATANIHGNTIVHIRDNPFSGCQNGVGIAVGSSSPVSSGSATITNNTILDYQKNGMVIRSAGSTATITSNVVTGMGPQTLIAQNGIQVSSGALATVTGNTVTGQECNHVSCGPNPLTQTQSVGILLFGPAAGTTVTGNTVTTSDIGIYNFGPSSIIDANNVLGNRFEGIFLDEGHANVTNNRIDGGNVGIDIISFSGSAADSDGTLTCNRITNAAQAGIRLADDPGPPPTANNATATTHNNSIQGNAIGFDNTTANVTDATNNWWGCPTGANTAGCDTAVGPVTVVPFLAAPPACAPQCGIGSTNGDPCDDGDACTFNETCQNGLCVGTDACHFLCWEVEHPASTPNVVQLVDQFGPVGNVKVIKARRLCDPANVNNQEPGAENARDHLVAYQTRPGTVVVHPNVTVVDEFGTRVVDLTRSDRLMVPSAKTLAAPLPPPLTAPTIDHFKCYRVRPHTRQALPVVTVVDEIGTASAKLLKPLRLCTPVDKNAEDPGAEDHSRHLMCYKIKSPPRIFTNTFVTNQFESDQLLVDRRDELCVPALKNPPPTTTTTSSSTTTTSSSTTSSTVSASPSFAFDSELYFGSGLF